MVAIAFSNFFFGAIIKTICLFSEKWKKDNQKKNMFASSCESSARQTIHMKWQTFSPNAAQRYNSYLYDSVVTPPQTERVVKSPYTFEEMSLLIT